MPDDPTPLGDAMTHRFPEQKVPDRGPGASGGDTRRGRHRVAQDPTATDISHRPPLPRGATDEPKPLKKQRG